MFSYELCEIFENAFFYRTSPVAASVNWNIEEKHHSDKVRPEKRNWKIKYEKQIDFPFYLALPTGIYLSKSNKNKNTLAGPAKENN